MFEAVGLLEGDSLGDGSDCFAGTDASPPTTKLPIGIRDKYIYRVAIQISLQSTESVIYFRFEYIRPLYCHNISIGQKFTVDKMNMAKTAVSHSGSEAWGPGQWPTSPMPRAGSGVKPDTSWSD